MLTLILPGFSPNNKGWVDAIVRQVKVDDTIKGLYWEHWSLGGGFRMQREKEKILSLIAKNQVNIIAKSVGTGVFMEILPLIKDQVNKVILCGIPNVSDSNKDLFLKAIEGFDIKKIVCIQNERDPLVTFDEAETFLNKINLKIKIIRKPRNDHNYPFFKDFEAILKA